MQKTELILPDESRSELLATQLSACLEAPLTLTFSGQIGAGKTTLIRAMLRALGITSAIKSPTFSLVESYQCPKFHVHHFDLYRIHDEAELEYIGFRDYFHKDSVSCIEWPEHAKALLQNTDLNFCFSIKGSGRLLVITAASTAGERILSCLTGK
ncbi:tRNA (adenosine(37)-N6)-threonylcarbamoyltransferase complex ATPase subunit type 1 TsaE [Legionella jordanis]|uniref:tRNA threonylcarbamoyladenosine biosynthesis protein TsaE n=1 Tax=Legionella jordanis TaxID=456 RepID=A0A0W0VBN9_9GAMM|nr:tRNA (adenosine(37)-N6)-threonylcarbamoyltransferase complex ATPase subunit type 1 TsaE [Legionella jordanis]KTD17530.1 ATPase or kinase [Legionella jordanis]RMX05133.1 tRNA (adenosine(37)-N6)-threonylcarbamoyltransferase complex ATPase subunit type 1 TsaE [Legionella jordanis]RMX17389.1 tRNA (adenosine(37)-N6)-threonylcarbamoyltransferase complex ATPase subunit type 1 TsaE [Legionella jordanis]VEH13499.1 ATPase or kinase [Legionella jordanis]HAT8714416.1 tRNA (adenosine(37)-N6)-threonylcar